MDAIITVFLWTAATAKEAENRTVAENQTTAGNLALPL